MKWDKGIKWQGGRKIILPVQRLFAVPHSWPEYVFNFSKSYKDLNAPIFSQTCRFLPVHTACLQISPNFTSYLTSFFSLFPNFKIYFPKTHEHPWFMLSASLFFFLSLSSHVPLIPGSQRVLFRWGMMVVQRGWQQTWKWGLGSRRRGMGWRLMLMVVMVDGRTIMRDDRRGGGADIRSWGRSRWGWVASSHAGVGRGSSGECGGGRTREAISKRQIVEEESALVDEALDDCLVGAGSSQSIHGGEIWSHECGPEADWQILAGHQVKLVVLAHPGKQRYQKLN